MASFDLVVIGAGMAGINAAARAVEAEARAALIERERVGGPGARHREGRRRPRRGGASWACRCRRTTRPT